MGRGILLWLLGVPDSDHHSSRYLLSLERAEGTSTRRTGRFRAGLDRSGSCPCGARLRTPFTGRFANTSRMRNLMPDRYCLRGH